jgi:hypothetical protein
MNRTSIHSLTLLLLFVPLGFARPKTDIVTLVNKNEVTCEIRSLRRGVLTAKTDSLNTVSIRWQDVVQVRSEFTFEIALTDGSTHLGALTPGPAGDLLVAGTADIPLRNIVALTPIGSGLANRFDGAVDFGYSFMKSQSTTQLNFNGEAGYTTLRRSVECQVSSNLVIREQTTSTQRLQAGLTLNETLSRGNFAVVMGQFSNNNELNLLQRYLGGGGIGRHFVRTNHSILSAYAGGAYSSEHYAGADRRNNGEALIAVNAQVFRLYSPKVDITGDFKLWPNLTTSGRFRIDANARARVEVYKNLFVSFSLFDSYDRKNPTTTLPLNDYGFVMSVGYSFNR